MKTLKDLIERFKKINKIAVIDKKDYRKFSYTYKQLYLLSKKFSLLLNENRIKKGDKILVWSQNGIEYLSILFGSILQGVILVPIDLRSNLDFVKKIQKQVKAKLILQTKYKPKSSLKTIFIEDLLSLLENTTNKNSLPKINPSDIVEILYTSGTTGEPKGVILTHKNFISNFNSIIKIEALDSDSKFLSLIPLSHIFEQTVGLFIPLYFKTTIVYIKTLKTSTLFETFKEENITNAIVVPRILELIKSGILQKVVALNQHFQFHFLLKIAQLFHLSLRKLLFKEIHEILGYNLKYFICGGAPLDIDLERFYEALGIPVVQGYGLTETSPILTTNLINDRKIGSVGKVISNVKLKILDNEILAKGNNITKGYYKNPEKTREAFEDSWFKTGDLGYFKNKFLYLKGRKKEVIVTQAGIKVYPEDVEKILNKIRGVKDSCVLGIKGKKGEEVYAVLLLKEKLNAKNIIEEANKNLDISQKIKDYSIWPFEDFPRTTTLKIKKFEVKDFIEKKIKPIITQKKSKVYNILSKYSKKKINPNIK
ncbi:AMP-binding protein, partial [Candidatus Woesearchaeota archaeon]|nr:AMP-binding protein [Candidatus Woesearchaeota archaeon]